jgi:hypothetical protein
MTFMFPPDSVFDAMKNGRRARRSRRPGEVEVGVAWPWADAAGAMFKSLGALAMSAKTVAMSPERLATSPGSLAMSPKTLTMLAKTVAMSAESLAMPAKTVAMSPESLAMPVKTVAMSAESPAMSPKKFWRWRPTRRHRTAHRAACRNIDLAPLYLLIAVRGLKSRGFSVVSTTILRLQRTMLARKGRHRPPDVAITRPYTCTVQQQAQSQ